MTIVTDVATVTFDRAFPHLTVSNGHRWLLQPTYSKTCLLRISGEGWNKFAINVIRCIDITKFVIKYNEFAIRGSYGEL